MQNIGSKLDAKYFNGRSPLSREKSNRNSSLHMARRLLRFYEGGYRAIGDHLTAGEPLGEFRVCPQRLDGFLEFFSGCIRLIGGFAHRYSVERVDRPLCKQCPSRGVVMDHRSKPLRRVWLIGLLCAWVRIKQFDAQQTVLAATDGALDSFVL